MRYNKTTSTLYVFLMLYTNGMLNTPALLADVLGCSNKNVHSYLGEIRNFCQEFHLNFDFEYNFKFKKYEKIEK